MSVGVPLAEGTEFESDGPPVIAVNEGGRCFERAQLIHRDRIGPPLSAVTSRMR